MSAICRTASSTEITQQVRDFAKQKGLDAEDAVAAGLLERRSAFEEAGGEIYS